MPLNLLVPSMMSVIFKVSPMFHRNCLLIRCNNKTQQTTVHKIHVSCPYQRHCHPLTLQLLPSSAHSLCSTRVLQVLHNRPAQTRSSALAAPAEHALKQHSLVSFFPLRCHPLNNTFPATPPKIPTHPSHPPPTRTQVTTAPYVLYWTIMSFPSITNASAMQPRVVSVSAFLVDTKHMTCIKMSLPFTGMH